MCRFWTRLLLSLALLCGGLGAAVPVHLEPTSRALFGLPAARGKLSDRPRVEILPLLGGRRRRRVITPGIVHSYSFSLKSGEFVRLRFEQESVDVTVDLFGPLNRHLLRVDALNGSHGAEDVPFVAAADGIYEVRVSSQTRGTYSSQLLVCRTATARDRILGASVLAYSRGEEARLSDRPRSEIKMDYEEAVRLSGEVGETLYRADAYFQLGDLHCAEHRWADCRDAYLHSLSLYEDSKNLRQQAVVLNRLGRAAMESDQSSASAFYRRSIKLSRQAGDREAEATAYLSYGLLLVKEGDPKLALENAERSLELNKKRGSILDEVSSLNECGRIYTAMGKIDKALSLHAEARKLLSLRSDSRKMAETLLNIGDAYREGNQLPLAINYYIQALDLYRKQRNLDMEALTLNNLSIAFYHSKKYQEAFGASFRATEIFHNLGRTADESAGWVNVGWVKIAIGDLPQSLKAFETALSLEQRMGPRPTAAAAYFGMAWTERDRNNLIGAERNVRLAIEIIESLRRQANTPIVRTLILGRRINFYEFLVELLMEKHQIQPGHAHDAEAFEASERARARTLLEAFGEGSAAAVLSLAEIQQRVLDNDTILLEYYLGDAKSYLWAVTSESSASFELPGRAQVESLAREVIDLQRRSNGKESLPEAVRKTRQLAQMLIGPVATRLGDKTLLLVLPPSLQGLSFAAFPDLLGPEDDDPVSSWPPPLILRHAIVSAPSASVIAALRANRIARSAPRHFLATVYDPIYDWDDERLQAVAGHPPLFLSDSFKRLRHSQKEADKISSLAGRRRVLKLSGIGASRQRILGGALGDYRYLHFSVHGDASLKEAERAALVLSAIGPSGTPVDPYLRARDIQGLTLSADLVVLSACKSGLGVEYPGEGLVGLPHAFLTAGAAGVIVSLWDVDDLATSNFMPLLYSNLLERGLKPAQALRQAQVEMWRQRRWNAPSYWAGFIGMGEWR